MFLLGWRGNVLRCALDPLGYLANLHRTYGDVAALVRGGNGNVLSAVTNCPGTIVVFGPHYNKEVLGNPDIFHVGLVTGLEGTPLERLGAGMFNTNGTTHKQLRREMAPAFAKNLLASYHPVLVARTRQILKNWQPGQRLDVLREMSQLLFRTNCKIFCGLDDIHEIDALRNLLYQWVQLAYRPAVRLLPFDLPFTPFRRFLGISRRLDQNIAELLHRKNTGAKEEYLFETLRRAGSRDGGFLSERECVGQALTLFIGAHDAPAAALAWTFLLLAQHPQVAADLLDELDDRLHGEAPTLEQLGQLPLLERVVKESLRILPPVPFAGRVAAVPTQLGPYHLPAGTEVLYSQYVTHRLPELYPQPARFLPDRWARLDPSPYEYLPFGAGPRRCLGASLGMSQIQTVVAMVLQHFRLQLVSGTRVDRLVRLALQPRGGMPMIVCAQDRQWTRSKTNFRGNVREMVDWS
jgi:cytochrome P450